MRLIGYAVWTNSRHAGADIRRTGIYSDGTTRPITAAEAAVVPCVVAGGNDCGIVWGADLRDFLAGNNVAYLVAEERTNPALAEAIRQCREALTSAA